MRDSDPAVTGPLSGITVIEVASFIAGPYVAMLLADLGAQVIKLEVPGSGDPFREWGEDRGASPQFAAFNRNKRSVECDLKSDAGRRQLSRLLAGADVLVENMRPGKMAALGLGYDELHQAHPRLIYCSVTGMGRPGRPASSRRTTPSSRRAAACGACSPAARLPRRSARRFPTRSRVCSPCRACWPRWCSGIGPGSDSSSRRTCSPPARRS